MIRLFIVVFILMICLNTAEVISLGHNLPGPPSQDRQLEEGQNSIRSDTVHTGTATNGRSVRLQGVNGRADVGSDGVMSSGRFEGGERGGTVQVGDGTFTLSSGQSVTYENGRWTVSPKADEVNTPVPAQRPIPTPGGSSPQPRGRTQPATFRGFSEGTIDPQGNYEARAIEKVEQGDFLIFNGQNIRYFDGIFSIEKADRIEIKDGILTQVVQFRGTQVQFHVGSTKDVLIGCLAMRQVRDSDFTINDQSIIIEPAKGVEFDIADCGFAQNHFKAYTQNSKIVISKTDLASISLRMAA